MNNSNNNLLINLNKWASGQDENFTTDAFVHLLRHLQDHEPAIVRHLLRQMTNGRADLDEAETRSLMIDSQIGFSTGRPDISIVTSKYLIFVEVKVTVDLRECQLKRYRRALRESGKSEEKCILILLSRRPSTKRECLIADFDIRWHQVAEWLASEVEDNPAVDIISRYVINQFVEFLREKMPPPIKGPISDEYQKLLALLGKRGQDHIRNLQELYDFPTLYSVLTMMDEIIDSEFKIRALEYGKLAGPEQPQFIGYEIQVKDKPDEPYFYFVICFSQGTCTIVFMTFACKIDVGRFKGNPGRIIDDHTGPLRWQNELSLGRMGVDFFSEAKSSEEQREIIEDFYKGSWEIVQQIAA